jgi:endogenous inhibitor of DNA gyrase (YacG/DUF329 family)
MRCPICQKPADTSPNNRARPFCSERCRLIDLGTWAGEEYRVAGGRGDEDKQHPDDLKKRRLLH